MKNKNIYQILFCCTIFVMVQVEYISAQGLGEIDGTLEIKMNSTSGTPHIRLFEDDTSSGGSTRIELRHMSDGGDKYEIRSFLDASVDQRLGWYYNNSARVIWNENDNGLGIGTSNPTEKLHVEVIGNDGITIQGNNTGDARLSINNGAGTHFIFDDDSDSHELKIESNNGFAINTGGVSERLHISSTGEVGINTPGGPGTQLNVFSTTQSIGIECLNNRSASATGVRGRVTSGTAGRFGVFGWVLGNDTGSAYGVYGIAETGPSNSWASYANGDFWYAGTLKSPSDIRLKQNIQDLPSVLDKVLQLETKTYEYNKNLYKGLNLASGTQVGFIAQDLQNHFPTLVEEGVHTIPSEGENGETVYEEASILSVSNIEMIPILTKAIQEQQVLINELRDELNQLKSEK